MPFNDWLTFRLPATHSPKPVSRGTTYVYPERHQ